MIVFNLLFFLYFLFIHLEGGKEVLDLFIFLNVDDFVDIQHYVVVLCDTRDKILISLKK